MYAHVDKNTSTEISLKRSPFGWHCVEASGFWFTVPCLCESQQSHVNSAAEVGLALPVLTCSTTPTVSCRQGEDITDSEQKQ